MKTVKFLSILIVIYFISGCDETTIYESDPAFSNDLLHGNISGIVVQKESGALVTISQEKHIISVSINPEDGIFRIEELEVGNYDITIEAENYRKYSHHNVDVKGGGTTYLGQIDLSTIPDLVSSHYPEDKEEVVYDNRSASLTISMRFTQPMDRESVEEAFKTEPPTEGTFYWGNYTYSPVDIYFNTYSDRGFGSGASITTYTKITSFTYRVSQKDCFPDTVYNVRLETSAKDTAGNYLRFPLEFSFSTVQSASSISAIQTFPYHGDVDVDLINEGIQITFPRRMNQESVEQSLSLSPQSELIFLWPEKNRLIVYTGGAFIPDTTYYVEIDSTAEDLDGTKMGNLFSFTFSTASVGITRTSPRNGQLFVNNSDEITIWFNTYMIKSSVQNAFTISPEMNGSFSWGTPTNSSDNMAITFYPSRNFTYNTKYTVTVSTVAEDLFGYNLAEDYKFSFVTRPQ